MVSERAVAQHFAAWVNSPLCRQNLSPLEADTSFPTLKQQRPCRQAIQLHPPRHTNPAAKPTPTIQGLTMEGRQT